MTSISPLRVTFDTNACDVVHDHNKKPGIIPPKDALKLRHAIENGRLRGYVSAATLFVECLSFEDKLAYLAMAGTGQVRPVPHPKRTAVFSDLASLGFELLHAPLIGSEVLIPGMKWAVDETFNSSERLSRYGAFIQQYPRHNPLRTIGQGFLAGQPPIPAGRTVRTGPASHIVEIPQDWAIAIKREWDARDGAGRKKLRNQIGPIISEWCDTLIVGSHIGYGNDIFCTADEGGEAGSNSLLFHGNRANLKQRGVTVMSPRELLQAV